MLASRIRRGPDGKEQHGENAMAESTSTHRVYDLFSQAVKDDPYPVFDHMRQADPVCLQPDIDGQTPIWFLTRYDDVELLLRDDDCFVRDERNALPPEQVYRPDALHVLLDSHMLNKDGAEHRRLRTLVGKAFTPARTRALRPHIQSIADQLIDGVQERGEMDLIADYAFQVPTIVISELLGVPVEDRQRFKAWSDAFVGPALDAASQARAGQLLQEFVEYLRALFAARRQAPQDDLISALVHAQEADDLLSEEELFSTVVLLIVAGHETTVNLIGNAVLGLLRQPEARRLLVEDSSLMEAAVEEFLRYDSPVERALVRWAARDIVLGGRQIKRGDMVVGILGAANRDPAHFAEPERLDLHRRPQRHLAFGHGAHYCLGAALARLEGEIALNTLLRRLPNLRLAVPESELVWRTVPIFRGLLALPVTWK
jgi:cytochrome P450